MVSKASEDLPDPLSPVMTVKVLRGISTSIFLRLCWRAPGTVMLLSIGVGELHSTKPRLCTDARRPTRASVAVQGGTPTLVQGDRLASGSGGEMVFAFREGVGLFEA